MPPVRSCLALGCAALALAAGACGDEEDPEAQVRGTLERFAEATAAKDYQALCDELFAPRLVDTIKRLQLPCEVALQQSSLAAARNPTLEIERVTVRGDTAEAVVRTDAANQPSSLDTVRLVRRDGGWRIASLASPGPSPGP